VLHKIFLGILFLLALSAAAVAIHTPETRYSVEQTTIEQRNIVHTENRYGQQYVKPLGGYGKEGASQGSFGRKGAEEGASNLPYNSFIARGRDPGKISNAYASAKGYQVINKYVKLEPVSVQYLSRPQVAGSPQGHARIISRKKADVGLIQADIELRTRDLPPTSNLTRIYEAWLVDEDTGTTMSIGIFQPGSYDRVATLRYKSITPLDPFETIIVTQEPFPDNDPRAGEIFLSGDLKTNIVRTY
jgi:hypothetical protein